MATQAAARQADSRRGSEAEDPPHRHHPGRADRRGAAGPQAREHHDRPVGEEHVRRPVGRAAAQLAAVRAERQRLRRALLRRHGRAHRGRQRDHLAVAAEADRQDSEAGPVWVLPLDERSRGKITLARHDDPVPVRHAAAAAAAAAAARVGARVGADRASTGSSRPSPRCRSCSTSSSSSTCATSTGRASRTSRRSPTASCRWW